MRASREVDEEHQGLPVRRRSFGFERQRGWPPQR
jgi:hypothetical protein